MSCFVQSTHGPDNATLVIAGDFDSPSPRPLVERYFGPIVNPSVPRIGGPVGGPTLCGAHSLHLGHNYLFTSYLEITWPLPRLEEARDRVLYDVLALELEYNLFEDLVRMSATAKWVDVDVEQYATHALLTVAMNLNPHSNDLDWRAVEARVTEAANDLSSMPVSTETITRRTAELRVDHIFLYESSANRTLALVRAQNPSEELAALRAVEPPDLMRAAAQLKNKWLTLFAEQRLSRRGGVRRLGGHDPCP